MKFLVTTSKRPSRRVRSFLKDFVQIFNFERIVRGKKSFEDLQRILKKGSYGGIIVIDTKWGNPSRLRILKKDGSTFQIIFSGVKLLRELREKPPIINSEPLILANNPKSLELAKILDLKTVDSIDSLKENVNVIVLDFKNKDNDMLYLLSLYNVKTKKYYGPIMKIKRIA